MEHQFQFFSHPQKRRVRRIREWLGIIWGWGGCGVGGGDGGFKVLNCSRSCAETNLCQSDIYNHSFHYPLGSLWHIYPCAFKSSDFYTSFYIQSLQIFKSIRQDLHHPSSNPSLNSIWIEIEIQYSHSYFTLYQLLWTKSNSVEAFVYEVNWDAWNLRLSLHIFCPVLGHTPSIWAANSVKQNSYK